MDDLKKIKKLVMAELKQNPVSRTSDQILFLNVCDRMGVDTFQSLDYLILTHQMPSFESCRRARQKIQREHPELKDELTADRRAELETKYKAFVNA